MVFSDEALRIGEIVGGAVILPSGHHTVASTPSPRRTKT
jgi:hypothetical protein